jgi:hypothetical protein
MKEKKKKQALINNRKTLHKYWKVAQPSLLIGK